VEAFDERPPPASTTIRELLLMISPTKYGQSIQGLISPMCKRPFWSLTCPMRPVPIAAGLRGKPHDSFIHGIGFRLRRYNSCYGNTVGTVRSVHRLCLCSPVSRHYRWRPRTALRTKRTRFLRSAYLAIWYR